MCAVQCYYFRYGSNDLEVEVVYEGVRMLTISDGDVDHGFNHASSSILLECGQGRRLWVRAFGSGIVNGSEQRSLFTVMQL